MNQELSATTQAFDSSPVAQAILSSKLDIVASNPKFERTVNNAPVGTPFSTLFDNNGGAALERLAKAVGSGHPSERHLLLCLASKQACDSEVIVTITELSGTGSDGNLLATVHPLTRAEAGEAIRRHREELERLVAERTEALQRMNKELEMFSYSVSHDLRSPLRSVLGFSSALEEDYSEVLGPEGRDYLARISAAAHRMDVLITSILAVSRISTSGVKRSDVDLSEMANSLVPEVLRSFPKTHIIVQPGIEVNADPALLRVVLANLLDNACKFSSKVVEPKVELGIAGDLPDKPIYVKDNGVGFEEKYAEKIFEPFERLRSDSEFPGTGIGLSNVRRVIDRHQGKVWAKSEPNKGATFYFTLQ